MLHRRCAKDENAPEQMCAGRSSFVTLQRHVKRHHTVICVIRDRRVCLPCLIRFYLHERLLQLTVWENTTFAFGHVPLLLWKMSVMKPSVHLAATICSFTPGCLTMFCLHKSTAASLLTTQGQHSMSHTAFVHKWGNSVDSLKFCLVSYGDMWQRCHFLWEADC